MRFVIFVTLILMSSTALAQDSTGSDVLLASTEVAATALPSPGVEAMPCIPTDSKYLESTPEALVTGTGFSVVTLVLMVELLRWLIKPLRRKKNAPLPEWGRGVIAGLSVLVGQIMAFAGIVPAVREGVVATILAGFVATSISVLFNETIFAWARNFIEKKFENKKED